MQSLALRKRSLPADMARFSIAIALFLIAFIVPSHAGQTAFVEPAQMGSGSLLLKSSKPGQFVEAPRVATDFDVTITGPIARTRVTQRFENPTDGWVEGVYVFPLPDNSAVDTLKMVVGNHVIVGDIKERQEAKKIYEEAKAEGQKAALLEQERPNLFTNSVANIGPHETVVVQMEYQEGIRQSGGEFALRIPMVMGPRYNPAPQVLLSSTAEAVTVADPVPDRGRIEPPVLDPRVSAPVNPVTLTVHLNAGFPLDQVVSHHHKVAIAAKAADANVVTLDGPAYADRDFELTWRAKAGAEPSVGLFHEQVGIDQYVLAIVSPPAPKQTEVRQPREVIFVIDNSGSMGGPSMDQAKSSLVYALSRLDPADRFNVIRFDDTMEQLFQSAVQASRDNIDLARSFTRKLEAEGGTEMVAPLRAALADSDPQSKDYLRQVIFLTDGAIGNEQEMFDILGLRRGRSRVFMVGIGSAPNSFLMTRMAEIGRGTFTHIGEASEVEARMRELFGKLENPSVTDLKAALPLGTAEVSPDTLPDLYRGEPVVVMAKLPLLSGVLSISGKLGGNSWLTTLPLEGATEGSGIARLWARRKIDSAEVAVSLGEITQDEADARVLKMALEHHLVSRRTSLVAVDKTPDRPRDQLLTRAEVPLNLPAGWDFDKVFGEPVQTRHAEAEFKQIAVSPLPKGADQANAAELVLPQTATPAGLLLWLGSVLTIIGLGLGFLARRGRLT
jgi:Ca-activated chloride channel family protein